MAEALDWTGIADLAERPVDALSGGQRQRAWISMALAQGTDLLLLDEPTTFLDLAHQVDVLELVRAAAPRDRPHRGDGAARPQPGRPLRRPPDRHADGADRRVGDARARCSPRSCCAEVFDLDARVIADPVAGTPLVVPIGGHSQSS